MKKHGESRIAQVNDGTIERHLVPIRPSIRLLVFAVLVLTGLADTVMAQEVFIPDPGLNAAIREALQKPAGPLTGTDLLALTNLDACCRNVKSIEGLEAAHNLIHLDSGNNLLTNLNFPSSLTALTYLNLNSNPFTNVWFPDGLTNLTVLNLAASGLAKLTLPAGMSRLTFLNLSVNQLTDVTLPADMKNLNVLDLGQNQLTNLTMMTSLTNLIVLALQQNQLTSLTLPPEVPQLGSLLLAGNPLNTLVLSEPAATNLLASLVVSLQNGGINVFTYPLTARLIRPQPLIGAFQFAISGPPGAYTVLGSTNLADWSELGVLTNRLGKIGFTDGTAHLSLQKFYRTRTAP